MRFPLCYSLFFACYFHPNAHLPILFFQHSYIMIALRNNMKFPFREIIDSTNSNFFTFFLNDIKYWYNYGEKIKMISVTVTNVLHKIA